MSDHDWVMGEKECSTLGYRVWWKFPDSADPLEFLSIWNGSRRGGDYHLLCSSYLIPTGTTKYPQLPRGCLKFSHMSGREERGHSFSPRMNRK